MSKPKLICWLLILLLASGAAVVAWRTGLLGKRYTATASLMIARCQPHILSRAAEKYDPVEFECFRDNQASLVKSRFVIVAALRDPKLKNRACIAQEDGKHNAVPWLTDEIRIDFPTKNAGLMKVSATEPDPEDAAAIVNAVVDAYLREVIDSDRQQRAERLSELQKIAAEKETEVRKKREELRRDLESLGVSDDRTAAQKEQLASSIYAEYQREFQRLRGENRMLLGKLKEATTTLRQLPDFEIPEIAVAAYLNNNHRYCDLQNRLDLLESSRPNTDAAAPGTKPATGLAGAKAELDTLKAQLEKLETDTRDQVRNALRIELQNDVHRLETQVEISGEQLRAFEKEIEKKRDEAESVGRSSIAAQMARVEVENIEQVLRAIAMDRETLKVEIKARDRVSVCAKADVPESPD